MKKTIPKVVDIALCSLMTPVYTIPVMPMNFSPKFSKSGHNRNEPNRYCDVTNEIQAISIVYIIITHFMHNCIQD